MSVEIYVISDSTFELARERARSRAAEQWADETCWNLWATFHTDFNIHYFDPWYESEIGAPDNGPATSETDEPWKQTQNMYYIYAWMKYKGYDSHVIMAAMTSMMFESRCSGGAWEMAKPYSDLTSYTPNSDAGPNSLTWYSLSGSFPNYSSGQYSSSPTGKSFTDETGTTWSKAYPVGSYIMMRKYDFKYTTVVIPGYGNVIRPVGWDVDPPASLVWDTDSSTRGPCTGYGLVQWSPWNWLPKVCRFGATNGHINFTGAADHWQISGTLQLMCLEEERYISLNYPQYSDPDHGYSYLGQWVDQNAQYVAGSRHGTGFQWPLPTGIMSYPNPNTNFRYPYTLSWDDWANGTWKTWIDQQLSGVASPPETQDEWDRVYYDFALDAFMRCYQHASYTFDVSSYANRRAYIMAAVNYWDSHYISGTQAGWDVKDIPRPRDLERTELDQYHLLTRDIYIFKSARRKKRYVCTILL